PSSPCFGLLASPAPIVRSSQRRAANLLPREPGFEIVAVHANRATDADLGELAIPDGGAQRPHRQAQFLGRLLQREQARQRREPCTNLQLVLHRFAFLTALRRAVVRLCFAPRARLAWNALQRPPAEPYTARAARGPPKSR